MKYRVTDNQLWRKERLIKVEKLAASVLDMTVEQLRKHIYMLSDEKGQLFVFWQDAVVSPSQRQSFKTAWWACGEKEDFVQHVVSDKAERA